MGKTTKPSAPRLKEILRRQDPPKLGPDYIPSIRAVREEAPSRSRATQQWSELLLRPIHVLSTPELHVCLIVLFHPRLFELQEQRMLHYLPSPHPLEGHPKGAGEIRSALRGTLEIAEALGMLEHHATVVMPSTEPGHRGKLMPFPWVGDFLLFLEDSRGAYCVNLNVKNNALEFLKGDQASGKGKNSAKAAAKAKARHSIEAVYYLDGNIPTVPITTADYDKHLVANLAQIVLWSKRVHTFAAVHERNIIGYFKSAIGTRTPAIELVFNLARINDCEVYEIKKVFYQAIWRREIRIDLFQPLHINLPLLPELRDPLDVYAKWFARG